MLVSRVRKSLSKLYVQVLIGIVAGILLGHFYPDIGSQLKPLGDLFIKLIRMLLAPIIFASVVVGIARMSNLHEAGRVGVKAVLYFEVASTIALLVGMVVVNVFKPGSGMNIDPAHIDGSAISTYTTAAKQHGMLDFFMGIVPNSIVGAFANGEMLPIIFFSLLLAVSLARLGPRTAPFVDMLDMFLQGMFGVVRIVMYVAPIGAFGGMAFTIAKYGIGTLASFGQLMLCLYLTSIFFVVVVLGLVMKMCGLSLFNISATSRMKSSLRLERRRRRQCFRRCSSKWSGWAVRARSSAWCCRPDTPSTPMERQFTSRWLRFSSLRR